MFCVVPMSNRCRQLVKKNGDGETFLLTCCRFFVFLFLFSSFFFFPFSLFGFEFFLVLFFLLFFFSSRIFLLIFSPL